MHLPSSVTNRKGRAERNWCRPWRRINKLTAIQKCWMHASAASAIVLNATASSGVLMVAWYWWRVTEAEYMWDGKAQTVLCDIIPAKWEWMNLMLTCRVRSKVFIRYTFSFNHTHTHTGPKSVLWWTQRESWKRLGQIFHGLCFFKTPSGRPETCFRCNGDWKLPRRLLFNHCPLPTAANSFFLEICM